MGMPDQQEMDAGTCSNRHAEKSPDPKMGWIRTATFEQ